MSEERADYNPNDHMMNLKGKDYLPVAARILWCRRDHPDAIMRTTLVEWDKVEGFAMYRAEVTLPSGGHAEATATQTKKDFPQYVEKCESKALGRALGFLGYGTLAAEEEEPGNPNLSDTPVARPQQARSNGGAPTRTPQPPTPQRPPQTATAGGLAPNQVKIPCTECRHAPSCRTEGYCQAAAVRDSEAREQATAVVAGPNPHPEGSVEYVLHEARAKAAGGMGWQQVWAYLSEYQQALGADWGAVVKEWRAIKASIAG